MTMNIKETLPEGAKVKEVSFSPKGKYLLTKIRDPALESDGSTNIIHTIVTSKQVASVQDCIFTQISSNDDLALFVCLRDREYTIYGNLLMEDKMDNCLLPEGEIEGSPIMSDNGDYLIFIYELKAQKDRVFHQRFPQPGRKLMLCTSVDLQRTVSNKGKGLKELDYANWKFITADDYLLSVYPLHSDTILLLFAQGVGKPEVKEDKVEFKKQPKIGLIYSVKANRVLKFFRDFIHHDSDIDRLVISSQGTNILDQAGRIFSSADNKLVSTMTTRGIDHRTTQFLDDGKYVLTLTMDKRRIIIFASDTIEIKASIPIHGIANTIQTAKDGQILIVSCDDGRILLFRTLLDYRPAMGPASALVATHKFAPALRPRPEMPADPDEVIDSVSTLDPFEKRAIHTSEISAKPRTTDGVTTRSIRPAGDMWNVLRVKKAAGAFSDRRPSLKTLTQAITHAHRQPANKSRACVIQ